jgi:large subunit ribosomal protein L30
VTIAVVRVRGQVNINRDTKDALRMLHLTRANHCTIVPDGPVWKGQLQKVKDYVTWGEVTEETVLQLLQKRGRLAGNRPLTEAHLAKHTPYKSFADFAKALATGKAEMRGVEGMKPLFRLHPPRKGYEKLVRDVHTGGSLGDRGERINTLIGRML